MNAITSAVRVEKIGNSTLYLGDCMAVLPTFDEKAAGLILVDPPYGVTDCSWDSRLQIPAFWNITERLTGVNSPIVITCMQPFSSALVMSRASRFRHEWVWVKNLPTGFGNAKRGPMRAHESVLVFSERQPKFNPQPTRTKIQDRKLGGSNGIRASRKGGHAYSSGGLANPHQEIVLKDFVSPRTVLDIPCVPRSTGTFHPTQKPVALMDYMIRTYSDQGALVIDPCMGSGTTGVASAQSGRPFIGIEIDPRYFDIACRRISEAQAKPMTPTEDPSFMRTGNLFEAE